MIAFAIAAALALVDPSVATLPKPSESGAPWTATEIASLRGDLDALIGRTPALRGAHIGMVAIDSASGDVLYECAADEDFQPASGMKLLTGSAALARLGTRYTFTTVLGIEARPVPNPTSAPRLVLRAGGDPLLAAADLDDAAAAVASAGVTAISGIDIDESLFDRQLHAPGWSWDDLIYPYAPVVEALALNENAITVSVSPGSQPGDLPIVTFRSDADRKFWETEHRGVATGSPGSADTVDVAEDRNHLFMVTGSLPVDAKPEDISVAIPDPANYAADVLLRALRKRRIALPDSTGAYGTLAFVSPFVDVSFTGLPVSRVVWARQSEPIAHMLADFWYPSDNLIGEMWLKAMGVARGGIPGTAANGAALERDWLRSIGIDPATVDIADGSGLSTYDRITPRGLVAILQYDWRTNRDLTLDSLAVAGVRGTIGEFYKGTSAQGRVFAKDGYFSHTRSYSGFISPRRHRAVTFSLIVNDFMGDIADLRPWSARVFSRFIDD